jgi:type II secretory pathway component PulJ
LIAYVVALALLAILGIALWDWLPAAIDRACARARIIQHDSGEKTVVYEFFRPSLGGR